MTATWQPDGGDAVLIGDTGMSRGPGCLWIISLTPTFSQLLQVAKPFRAPFQSVFSRANLGCQVTIKIHREFSSIDDCWLDACKLGAAMGGQGSLRMTFDAGRQTLIGCAYSEIRPEEILAVAYEATLTFTGAKLE